MKNRLQQLLDGQFEYDTPDMQLSGRRVSLRVRAGETAKGAFVLTCPGEGKMRGILYATSPRIMLPVREFRGHENIVRFEVRTDGMKPGECASGEIGIRSDLGADQVRVEVFTETEERVSVCPDDGKLLEKAKKDFSAAAALFASPRYAEGMKKAPAQAAALYKALETEKNPKRRLEEYLVGRDLKESVDISSDWTGRKITDPEGILRETFTLTASTWGYLEIGISSDAHFLRPEKRQITTGDFIGNTCEVGFFIDSGLLHAGKNYGKITVRTPYRTIEVMVRADRMSDPETRRLGRVRKLMRKKALLLYLDYRTGRTGLHSWASRTESVLNAYRRAGGRDIYADFFTIFVLQADGKRREAERLLAGLKKDQDRISSADRYVFLLFLTTFFTRDSDYIAEVRAIVRKMREERPDDWKIRWVSLYLLEDDLDGQGGRLKAVLDQIDRGCTSPVMYLEGALEIRKAPFSLHEITPAMRQVLNFAAGNDLLTDQLYLQIASLEKRRPQFDRIIFRVLEQYADRHPVREVLEALCAMAIEGGKKDRSFFPLYRAAVMKEASVTGLYEYYMEAMDECRIETMPEIIRRYFMYNETLDYHKKARIFRNMADSRRQIPGIFRSMEPAIGKFLTDQLAQGHIDNDLAVLYEEFLTRDMLTGKLAGNLLRLLFTYRIECLSPGMKKVILKDSRLSGETEARLRGPETLVTIFSDETQILLEDGEGKRYASESLYMADHFMQSQRLLDICLQLVPDLPDIVLLYVLNTAKTDPVDARNVRYFTEAEGMRVLTPEFRGRIRGWLLSYYTQENQDPTLEHFLRHIHLPDFAREDMGKLQGLLAGEGFYEEAYSMVLRFGHEGTPLSLLVRICSQMTAAAEYQEDEKLLSYCSFCFFSGKYDRNILVYLTRYCDTSVSGMIQIWEAAREYGLETIRLEEKILSLILFTRDKAEGSEKIYASYRAAFGKRRLWQAYLSYMAYLFFVKGKPLAPTLFDDMTADMAGGERLPDICGLALLRYLSSQEKRTEQQDEAAKTLLGRFEDRDMCFSFFSDFPEDFHTAAGVREKVFFEYTCSPDSRVKLSYRPAGADGPYTEETMRDVFCGIRVREFILFGGQELECFTEEERKDGTRILSGTKVLKSRPVRDCDRETRYGKLSGLSEALSEGSSEKAKEILLDIRQTDALAKELFTLM